MTDSHGEIDYTASFTLDDIVRFQSNSVAQPKPISTDYTLSTLQTHAAPAVVKTFRIVDNDAAY